MEQRIQELESEIEEFEILQLIKQKEYQETQESIQLEFDQIRQAILTRRGGIIELKKLIEEREDDIDIT